MSNEKIRNEIHSAGLKYWQVADEIGISPCTFSIWLRHDLEGERRTKVMNAIKKAMNKKEA